MTDEKRLDLALDACEAFEQEWYEEHPYGSYTAIHYEEYRRAKRAFVEDYIEDYEREAAEAEAQYIEDYENDPEHCYGWHQQDMIDLRKMER